MSILILKANTDIVTYEEAANAFKNMYESVTGNTIEIGDDDGKSDLIIIGSDSVNDFVMNEVVNLRIDSLGIRYGTDDYCVRSYNAGDRKALIFAGGRGRSTLYAIYHYFEKYLNCHYFWDGDVICHSDTIPMDNILLKETPRFDYRGLRYFAHRGLKRFQAEHWSFEDWKQELDWMVKKRLNFFMLRIGMDDVWQRAFPDIVPYPEKFRTIEGVDANGFNDRSDFWTLKYRGQLRERVLAYARRLDLMYPTDCGTMTHWYSRTPIEFLDKKKPELAHQDGKRYCESDTGRVWDYMKKENMDNYMHLTDTMVEEYEKSTELFHTIGLGERSMYHDSQKNTAVKLIAYRRIAENIRKRYPSSKLMLASWDFIYWWKPEDVQKLVKELDPERTIIMDYTSEINEPNPCFENWGVVGKFPWIFGLFHAFESESELRGPYDHSDKRLKIAAADEFCKGMIFWPELSHSDPIVLEYLAENSWSPLKKTVEEITAEFCKNRYGNKYKHMNECWQKLLPFIKLGDWSGSCYKKEDNGDYVKLGGGWYAHKDIWTNLTYFLANREYGNVVDHLLYKLSLTKPLMQDIVSVLKNLSMLGNDLNDQFLMRDSVDMTRTILGRFMNYLIVLAISEKYSEGKEEADKIIRIEELKKWYMYLMDMMGDLLSVNDDFSIYETLLHIQSVSETNPNFETTLKRNIYNNYCTQPAYEMVSCIFKEEGDIAFDWLCYGPSDGTKPDFTDPMTKVDETFMKTPLKDMKPEKTPALFEIISKVANAIEDLQKVICK